MKPLNRKESLKAIAERAKWVYYTVLQQMVEIIMPCWQMVYLYLNSSSKRNRDAFMGFDRRKNGFPVIDPHTLIIIVGIMSVFDIGNALSFTFCVRQKFPHFNPFKLLNVLIKKYNLLLTLSILSVVLSIQCTMIIDCNFDIGYDTLKQRFS